jgi:hypothetical protein
MFISGCFFDMEITSTCKCSGSSCKKQLLITDSYKSCEKYREASKRQHAKRKARGYGDSFRSPSQQPLQTCSTQSLERLAMERLAMERLASVVSGHSTDGKENQRIGVENAKNHKEHRNSSDSELERLQKWQKVCILIVYLMQC